MLQPSILILLGDVRSIADRLDLMRYLEDLGAILILLGDVRSIADRPDLMRYLEDLGAILMN